MYGYPSAYNKSSYPRTTSSVTAITLAAHTSFTPASGDGGTTSAINTTGSTLLVLAIAYLGGVTMTVSDSKSNTWVARTEYASGAGNGRIRLYYVANPTVGSGHTFTFSGSSGFSSVAVAAFNTVVAASPYDVENGAGSASATSQQPGSITPTSSNELIVSGLEYVGSSAATIGSGMAVTDAQNGGANFSVALAWKAQTSAAAINPTWSTNNAADRVTAAIASFKHS